jgi:transcription elongation GreA/GreB family factor
VEPEEPTVQLGSTVTYREVHTGHTQTVAIWDERSKHTKISISAGSPLGKALMGCAVGDERDVVLAASLPARRIIVLKIG